MFTFEHYGRFEFIYTVGVMNQQMLFFNSTGQNLLSYCQESDSIRTCTVPYTGIITVVFKNANMSLDYTGQAYLEVKKIA